MIPSEPSIRVPLLKLLADGQEHSLPQVVDELSVQFRLTEAERQRRTPSSQKTTIYDRCYWARFMLKKAGFLEYSRQTFSVITDAGRRFLADNPTQLTNAEVDALAKALRPDTETSASISDRMSGMTPEEAFGAIQRSADDSLVEELLAQLLRAKPTQFEHIVVDVLSALGYGGSWSDAAQVVGKVNDEGIDGVIRQDRLGLDSVYVQAKRWQGSVSRPEVQKFVGALTDKGTKGVMIATSEFTSEARTFAQRSSNLKVILVDGRQLARLMIEHNVGVSTVKEYALKKLNTDYFMA